MKNTVVVVLFGLLHRAWSQASCQDRCVSHSTAHWDEMLSLGISGTLFGMNLTSRDATFWSNRVKREFVNGCNVEDGKKRCLPSLMIIGQAKAGTTGLFETLAANPQVIQVENNNYYEKDNKVVMASSKELNIYTRSQKDQERDLLFRVDNMNIELQDISGTRRVLEASPYYFSTHVDAQEDLTRFGKYVPDVKLVVIVRNPIDRA